MISPAPLAAWTAPAGTATVVRAAFATLDRSEQRLLEALLFDGQSCARLAASIGASATDIRSRAGAALLALHAALAPPCDERDDRRPHDDCGARGGAVAAMLVLRALDALDADETALVDTMLLHQPTLQRSYDDHRDLVGELCTLVPPSAPASRVLARLARSIDDDRDAN